ncbi:MAG: hypothetical protein ACM3N3_23695, partial [Betaproteobacteria bacterium]
EKEIKITMIARAEYLVDDSFFRFAKRFIAPTQTSVMQKQLESKPLLIRTPALTISKIALYVIFCRLLDLCATCGGCQLPSASSIEKLQ